MKACLRNVFLLSAVAACLAAPVRAAESSKVEFYGFVMMDMGYNAEPMHPDWFDVQRPTKLESFENEFGEDGEVFFSVRQTRFGTKAYLPTSMGELFTQFEFEMFGTGVDAGQTTIRLRHAYGQLGHFGAGQYWSPFMDIDVFPNTVEYWGPNGMAFFRNVQFRWMPVMGESRVTFALERPGASGDQGDYSDRISELGDIQGNFPLPDLSAEARLAKNWGYVEAAGIVRQIEWEDLDDVGPDLSDSVLGWGVSGSSNLKFGGGNTVARLQVVVGEGIQNYMNDAPVDVGVEADDSEEAGFKGVALPMVGISAFIDHNWSKKFSSSFGYSQLEIDNSDGQSANAFKLGQYALANIAYYPVDNVMVAAEGGWIRRENNSDGFDSDNVHVQFSFKYNFATTLGGGN